MIAGLTMAGAWDDQRDQRSSLRIGAGIASGLVCIVSVLAFFFDGIAVTLGRWLLPLSVLAGVQLAIEAVRDLRTLSPDPELSARENVAIETFGILAVGLLFGSAIVVGIATGLRQW